MKLKCYRDMTHRFELRSHSYRNTSPLSRWSSYTHTCSSGLDIKSRSLSLVKKSEMFYYNELLKDIWILITNQKSISYIFTRNQNILVNYLFHRWYYHRGSNWIRNNTYNCKCQQHFCSLGNIYEYQVGIRLYLIK